MQSVQTVPVMTFVCAAISMLVAIGLPIALLILVYKRWKANLLPAFAGAFGFVVFALMLEPLLHAIVLRPDPVTGAIALRQQPVLFMLYGGFAAGVFEETARLIAFLALKRWFKGRETALTYGVGHGGIEAVILLGLPMLNNIVISAMINLGQTAALTAPLQGAPLAQIQAAIAALTATPPAMFLVGGAERIMAVCAQIALSVLVWRSVNAKGRWWLFPVAIALHAILDFPAALMQAGALSSIPLVELITLALSAFYGAFAYTEFRKAGDGQSLNDSPQ